MVRDHEAAGAIPVSQTMEDDVARRDNSVLTRLTVIRFPFDSGVFLQDRV